MQIDGVFEFAGEGWTLTHMRNGRNLDLIAILQSSFVEPIIAIRSNPPPPPNVAERINVDQVTE